MYNKFIFITSYLLYLNITETCQVKEIDFISFLRLQLTLREITAESLLDYTSIFIIYCKTNIKPYIIKKIY